MPVPPRNPFSPIHNLQTAAMTPGSGVTQLSGMQYQVGQPTQPVGPGPITPAYTLPGMGGGGTSGPSGPSGPTHQAPVPPPPRIGAANPVDRIGDIGTSQGETALGQLDAAGQAAQAAVFGRAKDRAGQIARSSLSGLRSALAERGVLGSGMESQATLDAAMQGAGLIADTSREEAIQEAQRGQRAREFQTQAQLQERGQNINQRGQDLGQILGLRGQDITQRGQDVSASLQGLQAAVPGSSGFSQNPYWWQQGVPGYNY